MRLSRPPQSSARVFRRGFTLIEASMAMVIIGLGVVSLIIFAALAAPLIARHDPKAINRVGRVHCWRL